MWGTQLTEYAIEFPNLSQAVGKISFFCKK